MPYTTADIRNLALVGQAGAGKTLLAEALLAHSGAIRSKGSLARGTTVCDYDPQEKVAAAFARCRDLRVRATGSPRQHHRYAGVPGLPRPHAVGARSGRDRGDRRERNQWCRADDAPDDGFRESTRPSPPDRDQQDRQPRCAHGRGARGDPRSLRQDLPAAQSAGRQRQGGGRLLLPAARPARRTSPRSRRLTPRSSTRWSRSTKS